jgi:hypothetical protein
MSNTTWCAWYERLTLKKAANTNLKYTMAQAGTGFSLQRPVFNARPGHVEFVVYKFKMSFTTQLPNL